MKPHLKDVAHVWRRECQCNLWRTALELCIVHGHLLMH